VIVPLKGHSSRGTTLVSYWSNPDRVNFAGALCQYRTSDTEKILSKAGVPRSVLGATIFGELGKDLTQVIRFESWFESISCILFYEYRASLRRQTWMFGNGSRLWNRLLMMGRPPYRLRRCLGFVAAT
jgi:hypothetical protein